MRRAARAALAVTALAVASASAWEWAVPAYVETRAEEAARARGLEVRMREVRVSWGRIEASGVEVTSPSLPGQRAHLDTVVATVAMPSGELKEVAVTGGTVTLSGKVGEVRRLIREWRGSGPGELGEPGRTVRNGPDRTVEGVTVMWEGPFGAGSRLKVEGAWAGSGMAGAGRIRAEAGRSWMEASELEFKDGRIRVKGVRASLSRRDLGRMKGAAEPGSGGPSGAAGMPGSGGAETDVEAERAEVELEGVTVTAEGARIKAGTGPEGIRLEASSRSASVADLMECRSPRIKVRMARIPDGLELDGSAQAEAVAAESGRVATGEIEAKAAGLKGRAVLSDGRASFDALVSVGNARVKVAGEWDRGRSVSVDAEMEPIGCQALLESAPEAVVHRLVPGTRMSGTAAWRVQASVDLPSRKEPNVRIRLDNGCRVEEVPPELDVKRLLGPFDLEVYGPDGARETFKTGPGTRNWTPLALVSRFFPLAVRTTEDPGFLAHRGFHIEAIENSAEMNISEGRFVRGASTISMQLAKNLWLSREKTLSRKVQEAVLTTYLEQRLSKERILELYVNVVEFGPGLYGIGAASKRYFDAHPMQLSLAQSLFLASLLPNPSKNGYVRGGEVHPAKMAWLHRVMKAMRDRQLISEDEYADGIQEVLVYGRASTGGKETDSREVEVSEDGLDPGGWEGTD